MKMSRYSPEFERKVTISSDWLHFKERLQGSVQWEKETSCIFKPGLIAFLMCPMKFTFGVFSMVSAYAAPKGPRDYSKEKGYFITHRSLISERKKGPKMIPAAPRQVAPLNT